MSYQQMRSIKNRQFVRLHMTQGLMGELRLVEIKGQPLQSKRRKVMIKQLGSEGMVIVAALDFPITLQYVVSIDVELVSCSHKLTGQIIWKQLCDQWFEYGIVFILPPSAKRALIYSLNHILLKQSPRQARIHTMYRQMTAYD